jgi:predicted Zn-dependent protease
MTRSSFDITTFLPPSTERPVEGGNPSISSPVGERDRLRQEVQNEQRGTGVPPERVKDTIVGAARIYVTERFPGESRTEREVRAGQELMQKLLAETGATPFKGPPEVPAYVQGVLDKLVASTSSLPSYLQRPDLKYSVTIVESDEPIAVSVPGGQIVMSTSFLKGLKSEAELAGVLAHEIAHIARRHQMYEEGTKDFLSKHRDKLGVTDEELSATLADLERSREREADMFGAQILDAAGYRVDAMADLLERQTDNHAHDGEGGRYHPTSESRARDIRMLARFRRYDEGSPEEGRDQYRALLREIEKYA